MLEPRSIYLAISLLIFFGSVAFSAPEPAGNAVPVKSPEVTAKKTVQKGTVHASPSPSPISTTNAPVPEEVTLGVYLFNVRDVNTGRGTFTSDFCIWSRSTNTGNIISELQFANAERVVWSIEGKPEVQGVNCIKRCGTGTFRMKWELRDYPDDVQKLNILIDYTLKDSSKVTLKPDLLNSGVSKENIPQGWKFKSFKLEPVTVDITSNLGDSNLGNGRGVFPGLELSLEVAREESMEYWEMTVIAYSTVIMMFLSFFIDCTNTSRLGILGAAFIASIISLRTSMATMNTFDSRVSWLHFTVMGFITFGVICTAVLAYLHHNRVDAHKLRIYSMIIGVITLGVFVLFNYLLLKH